MTAHTPPVTVDGSAVELVGEPLEVNGESWVTLVPAAPDERVWEWSLTTGRLLLVDSGEQS